MGTKLLLFVIILCGFSVYDVESYPHADFTMEIGKTIASSVKLSCECNKEDLLELFNVSMAIVLDIFHGNAPCHQDTFEKHTRMCQLLEMCEACTAAMTNCKINKAPKTELDWHCHSVVQRLPTGKSNRIPRSPTGAAELALSRQRRDSRICPHPLSLHKSLLKTIYYHTGIKVIQKCHYGHTLSNGISRVYRCRYEENIWYPEALAFEGCQPFIHCEMVLNYHGTLKCTSARIDNPPVCHVTCPHYENKPADEKISKCDVDGIWKPELPHCASKVVGENLVPAPEIKLHYLEEEVAKGLGRAMNTLEEEH